MANTTFHSLLAHELQDLYDAEHRIVKALPKMIEKASNPDLKKGFETHLKQTEGQIERLEKCFKLLDIAERKEPCAGMKGILEEGEKGMEKEMAPAVSDASLIAGAQRVEHYEMAAYGTACAWADLMGHEEVAELLAETLAEEEETDEILSDLAESVINPKAMEESAN